MRRTRQAKTSARSYWSFVFLVVFLVPSFGWAEDQKEKLRSLSDPKAVDVTSHLPRYFKLEHETFLNSKGEVFSFDSLKGKIVVMDLIFTRCQGPCPLMSLAMKKLLNDLKDIPELHAVSISIDPEFDRPEVLQEYGKRYGYESQPWTFLTGKPEEIYAYARKVLKMASGDGVPDFHTTLFVLYDQDGYNRGYYNSKEQKALQKLKRDIQALAKESGE